jgi:hypothetical protein
MQRELIKLKMTEENIYQFMLRLIQRINKDIQTLTGKFYPKLVLEKMNQVIVKYFSLNHENRPIINEIN